MGRAKNVFLYNTSHIQIVMQIRGIESVRRLYIQEEKETLEPNN